jgi:lipopolysaccharide transport system ATP-binding protein
MTNPAISVRDLGKKYKLGTTLSHDTFRDHLTQSVKSIWHKIHGNSRLSMNMRRRTEKDESPNEIWALRDVNFDVHHGEVIGIIGRNSAGKSTLLKILSRITEPTEGEIRITGRVASLLEVGTGFHPELTGRENVFLNGAILGMTRSEIKQKFDEIVAFAEIDKFIDTPVKRYSSGMYVRLAFAVAAHLEPEILLVDEVLAVGDLAFQRKCLGKMQNVAHKGRTVIFVSHNMAAIRHLCQKALLLERGLMENHGTAEDCIERYIGQLHQRSGALLDHIKLLDAIVDMIDARVNGLATDSVHLASLDRPLEIELTFSVKRSCRVSLHSFLKDRQGQTIAIYSPGHVNDDIHRLSPGSYKLVSKILFPRLTKGRYFLDIGISEPGIRKYIDFPCGLELYVDGYPTKTGLVFEQGDSNGFQVLDGYVRCEQI